MADITLQDEGTIILLWPETCAGKEWIGQNIDPDATRWGAGDWPAVVCEPRYIGDIIEGMQADGLIIKV